MEYKITNTGDYLLIVDDSEIKELKWVFNNISNEIYLSIDTHMDYQYKIIAHLPLNNSPILEGVDLLPPLEDEVEKLADDYGFRVPYDGTNNFYDLEAIKHYKEGYNKAREKYKYTGEDMINAILFGMQKGLNLGKVDETDCDWVNNYVKSLQQPKMPIGFKCKMNILGKQIIETEKIIVEWQPIPEIDYMPKIKTTTNSQGLTQWVGEYIY